MWQGELIDVSAASPNTPTQHPGQVRCAGYTSRIVASVLLFLAWILSSNIDGP